MDIKKKQSLKPLNSPVVQQKCVCQGKDHRYQCCLQFQIFVFVLVFGPEENEALKSGQILAGGHPSRVNCVLFFGEESKWQILVASKESYDLLLVIKRDIDVS